MGTRLAGLTALVTGSTSNIGRAIAAAYASEGAHVAVSGRDTDRGDRVVAAIRDAGGDADFVPGDLDGTLDNARDLADRAAQALGGRVDVLVNNAAVVPLGDTRTTDETDLDLVWAVNVKAPFFLVAQVAPGMAERGSGAIVNVSSWMSRTGTSGVHAYAASKGALDVLTRNWAAEFGPSGVRVNSIAPGVVREDPDRPDPGAAAMRGTPYGKILPPDAIASAAVYLASRDAIGVHGTCMDVDGGRSNVAIFG